MKKIILFCLALLGGVMNVSADDVYLTGDWDSWDKTSNKFSSSSAGATVTIHNLTGNTTYEFKFYNKNYDSWSGNDGEMNYNNCSEWDFNVNKNCKIKTTISGDYTFTIAKWKDTTPVISATYPTSYTRSVTPGNFGTICLPYEATVTGATIFKIVSTVGSGDSMTGINIESVGSLDAGKPYIFKATGSTLTATLSGTPVKDPEAAFGMAGNLSPDDYHVSAGNYIVKDNKLRKVVVAEGEYTYVYVPQYRAYITLDDIGTSSARGANFIAFEDEATGIEDIQAEIGQNSVVYNLQGQRVTDNKKGLLIVNGQKMLIK